MQTLRYIGKIIGHMSNLQYGILNMIMHFFLPKKQNFVNITNAKNKIKLARDSNIFLLLYINIPHFSYSIVNVSRTNLNTVYIQTKILNFIKVLFYLSKISLTFNNL